MDIVAMLLQSSMRGASKTKLMYGAYLSYAQLKEYLSFVQERGLLAYEDGLQVYRLTPKGLHFLNAYEEVKEIVSLEGNHSTQPVKAEASSSQMPLEVIH